MPLGQLRARWHRARLRTQSQAGVAPHDSLARIAAIRRTGPCGSCSDGIRSSWREQAQRLRLLAHEVQRREVLQRKAHRIEHGDLVAALLRPGARPLSTCQNSVTGKSGGHLLDLSFDSRLRLELDEHAGVAQHVRRQFGLARTVAADGVDVHAGPRPSPAVSSAARRCVGSHGGDDIRAAAGFGSAAAGNSLDVERPQVVDQLAECARASTSNRRSVRDAQQVVKGQRLELALRAVADQRHRAAVGPRQAARRERRHRGGAHAPWSASVR